MNPNIAKAFFSLAGSHYPERLGQKIVLDPPAMFSGFWKIISPFIDPVTSRKIRFIPYKPATIRRDLLEFFDEATTDWLLEEIKQNREKAKQKVYRTPARGEDKAPGHDCRGTEQFFDVLVKGRGVRPLVVPRGASR
jgi:hypothetical protein